MALDYLHIERTFSKAASSYGEEATFQKTMAQNLVKLIENNYPSLTDSTCSNSAKLSFERVLEIGCGPGLLTHEILTSFNVEDYVLNDLSAAMLSQCQANLRAWNEEAQAKSLEGGIDGGLASACHSFIMPKSLSFVAANALELDVNKHHELTKPCELIVSNATFQWFNDLSAIITKLKELSACSKGLYDDKQAGKESLIGECGLRGGDSFKGRSVLAFSSFFEGTFKEIQELTGRGLDYPSLAKVKETLQAHAPVFELQSCTERQYFKSAYDLFKHLKRTGVTALGQEHLNAGQMRSLLKNYEERFCDDKGVYLTWCPYWVIMPLN